jgi:hypothetical protein
LKLLHIEIVYICIKAGSVDANIIKYAKIYENFGYSTFRIAPNACLALFQTHLHKKYALILLDLLLNKHKLIENAIIFHTFSNAGLFIYRHLSEIVHEDDNYKFLRDNVKTLIADSGPGFSTEYFKMLENINSIMENHIKFKPLRYTLAISGILIFILKNRILFNDKNYFKVFLHAMVDDRFHKPTLVFYSKSDRLISSSFILDYVEKRRLTIPNIVIKTVEFFKSEHCSHYLKYPKVYYEHLKSHILAQSLPVYENTDFSSKLPLVKSQL